jgi:hypothetical protein
MYFIIIDIFCHFRGLERRSSALAIEPAADVDIYHDVPQLCAEKPAVYAPIVDVLFIPGKFYGSSARWCRTI